MGDATTEADYLRTARAVRERCGAVLARGLADGLRHFRVVPARIDAAVEYVLDVIAASYPTLDIPLHARWRHFDVGGVPRIAALDSALSGAPAHERAAAKLDLAVVSVLLDAGAGPAWHYREAATDRTFSRSEGLAVASYRMFMAGAFSSEPQKHPLRADGDGLAAMTANRLAEGFHVNDANPLVGISGRVTLLGNLGRALRADPMRFGAALPRPGGLVESLARAHGGTLRAADVLDAVLRGFGAIWPGRVSVGGVNLGDVWRHDGLAMLVPFHKLSQWLTYSLVEPLEEAGLVVTGLEELTGLPEYRNGGLLLDLGVLELRDAAAAERLHAPGSELVVEWRALTVALLDRIGEGVRGRLGKTAAEFPLAKVLEGGTWAAGRKVAAEKRPGGAPPLHLDSDGTVF